MYLTLLSALRRHRLSYREACVLIRLKRNGVQTQSRIARRLEISTQNFSVLAKRLTEKGYIKRVQIGTDTTRAAWYMLTDSGRSVAFDLNQLFFMRGLE